MPDPLTREDVQRIAELASLELTEAEVDTFTRQLADFLAYAQQVQGIDTTGVPPTSHVTGAAPLDRPDDPRPSIPRDELLESAPDAVHGRGSLPRAPGDRLMPHHDLSTVRGVRDAVAAGDVSAVEICEASLAAIDARDADLHAFTAVDGGEGPRARGRHRSGRGPRAARRRSRSH